MLPEERSFEEIVMDFVGELPVLEVFNVILVVTDQFTNVQHCILAKITKRGEDIANCYINDIWKLYCLPRYITSDRGPQFASKFLNELNQKHNINLCLSTAYQPQMDGLSKRAIQTHKQYLRIYCCNRDIRWGVCLPLAEFTYNTNATTTH